MMKPRISLFAEHEREVRHSTIGDPLVGLTKHVDFEELAASIDAAAPRPSRAKGGRPPYPTVLMVKILVLQQLYNLADDALEYQLLDRRSFLQFLDLTESSSIPDAKTIWLFRDRLAQAGAGTLVFEQVQRQLQQHGYMARCGQIVDASLVQVPVQRNKREEAEIVKDGTMPLGWKAYKRAQKDVDARWTKKHGKSYFGYKLHASVDKRYKLLRKIVVTNAAVADTTVFEPLLDRSNTSRDVYADRGYPTAEREATLTQAGWRVHIQRKGSATKVISDTQKKRNRRIATPRARVEHVFGALAQMDGKLVRCRGIVRVTFALHLKAASYNLKRLVFLKEGGLAPF
jgi:IS5 family transposase